MDVLVILSLIVKSLGAVLDIAAQSLISQKWGVETFGMFSLFVSLSETFYNLFFAGTIKFNNFYISQGADVRRFKRAYYFRFTLPIFLLSLITGYILHYDVWMIASISGVCYLLAMDSSSTLMSYGKYKQSLIGEYIFGRVFLIIAIAMLYFVFERKNVTYLYFAYIVQFVALFFYYMPWRIASEKANRFDKCINMVSAIKKYSVFQSTEISHTIVMQTPIIVQYIFNGAYQTALVSIVLVVRRLINFVSGPTSKLYQPEFSRKFALNDKRGLAETYAQITRLQLCFMMPIFALLIAAPEFLLHIFNKELIQYGNLVRWTAVVFLYMIAFGPQSNFLSMAGKAKADTVSNWISVVIMYVFMLLFKENLYFVIIGFCAQIIYCTTHKLLIFQQYMQRFPMPIIDYLKLGMISGVCILLSMQSHNMPIIYMLVSFLHVILNFVFVLPVCERKELMAKLLKITKQSR